MLLLKRIYLAFAFAKLLVLFRVNEKIDEREISGIMT